MKYSRIIFLAAWILSLVGISFYGGPVSYGLFFLLTFTPVVSLIYLICVFACFRLYQEAGSRYPTASHAVPFFFTLVNEFHFGFVGIRVRLFSSFSSISGLDDDVEYELHPGTSIRKDTSLICRYRGEYEVGIKEIVIEDYFRLIRLRYRNRETMRVVVKPDLIELSGLHSIDLDQLAMREVSTKPVRPDMLVREYEAGDDIRLIHWKLSAGSGRPLVRKSVGEEQDGVMILLGTQRFQEDMRLYLPAENKVLETVLALSLYLAKQNVPIRTLTCQGELKEYPVGSAEQFDAYYQALSEVSFRENTTDKELFIKASGTRDLYDARCVLMVLQDLSAESLELAKIINDHGIPAAVFCISDEPPLSSGIDLPRTKIATIRPDADLREVL
ncbi:MAG: DUF58 domain-containing protein [Lachnospiraceae bacterium]|nr:DUF58 domain-containing protein [Lachnospiraceae bacterium]